MTSQVSDTAGTSVADADPYELVEFIWQEEEIDKLTPALDDDMLLPPPALPIEACGACGLLQAEILHLVTLCLQPQELCRMDALTSGCQRSPEVDAEVWAHLCALHFPTMYESVLNDIERGPLQKASMSPLAGTPISKRQSTGSSISTGSGTRGGARQTRAWRRQKPRTRQSPTESNQEQEEFSAPGSAEPSPELYPSSSPRVSPAESPSMSPSIVPTSSSQESPSASSSWNLAAESPSMSPSFLLASSPAESPSMSPSFMLDVSTDASPNASPILSSARTSLPSRRVEASVLVQADWRALYARRRRKKAEWEAGKKSSGRDRAASNASDDLAVSSPSLAKADSKRVSVSALSVREIGRLSDAAYRLKVCSLCGEKFSPGESKGQHTSCCFHPGDFSPAETRGWSRKDLKQLRLYARQALRSAGGASYVQRHPRASRGHGHWMKGLGVLANDMKKVRECLEGEVRVIWTCCDADELFAEGCQRGMHRHFP